MPHRTAALGAAIAVAVASVAGPTRAAEFRSVAAPAVLYDGPSKQARKLFAAPRGMPLEVISTLGQWVKVRDAAGDVVWIERGDLAERRSVVTQALVPMRAGPQDTAAVVASIDRGVLLELADPAAPDAASGWVRVRHRDGTAGFVRAVDVWGL
ncbi:MAG: SH3 domain-containing protein [Burkholderiaceae bacterium]